MKVLYAIVQMPSGSYALVDKVGTVLESKDPGMLAMLVDRLPMAEVIEGEVLSV